VLNRLLARIGVTALGFPAMYLAERILMPGLDPAAIPANAPRWRLSVFCLGVTPVLLAFLLVELTAAMVPRWRALRTGGPEDRARLGAPTPLVAILLALIQGWSIAQWLHGTSFLREDAWAPSLVIPLTVTAGALCLVLMAALIGRFGIANGYVVILVWQIVVSTVRPFSEGIRSGEEALALAVAVVTIVYATVWVLTRRVRAGNVTLRLPTGGLPPMQFAGLAYVLAWLHIDLPPVARVALFLAMAVLFSWLFSRPALHRDVVPDARGPALPWAATLLSIVYLAGLLVVEPRLSAPGITIGAAGLALATAAVMDLVVEVHGRLRADLVSIWPLHRVQVADIVLDALRAAGIEAHLRGAYVRALYHFFAPYVPIEVLVPRDRADDARAAIEHLFAPPPTNVFE
jgi:hypothetical protein